MQDDQVYVFMGRQLSRFRRERGLTQRQLGELCGLARSSYGAIESGNRRARVDVVWKIAKALECEFCELFPAVNGPAAEPVTVPVFLLDHRTFFRFRELVDLSRAGAAGLLIVKNQKAAFAASFQIETGQKQTLAEAFLKGNQVPSWKVLAERRSDSCVALLLKQPKLDSWVEKLAEVWLTQWLWRMSGE